MDKRAEETLRAVLHEARVIDFDFSVWDRRIRLVVLSGGMPPYQSGRPPVYNVDFVDATEVLWTSDHVGVQLRSPDAHCQWGIWEFAMSECEGRQVVELAGIPTTPKLVVKCRCVEVTPLDPEALYTVNPDWNKGSPPLARRGLADLSARIRERRS